MMDAYEVFRRSGQLVRSVVRHGKSHGVFQAAYLLLHQVLDVSFLRSRCGFHCVELYGAKAAELQAQQRFPRAFTLRTASPGDLHGLQKFFLKPNEVSSRLERGDLCFLLEAGGHICAAEWLVRGPAQYREDRNLLGYVIRVPEGGGWLYDGKGTTPGAWGSLMRFVAATLPSLGIQEVFLITDLANVLSRASHRSLGYRVQGRVWHLRLPGVSLRRYTNGEHRWRPLPVTVGRHEVLPE